MSDDPLLVARGERGVIHLTLNRPEVHNAFDDAQIARLTEAFQEAAADPAVRAVVLAANGKSFSAGADLNWMKRIADYSETENLADAERLATLLDLIYHLPKPTIARVQGPAYGGGLGLVAACDIAVAARSARFMLSEVRLGLIPAVISPYVVRAIGERQARRYFTTAERFDAVEAHRIGLVHDAVAEEAIDAVVDDILAALAKGGPEAIAESKDLVYAVADAQLGDAVGRDTARRIAERRASAEGREGIAAFLEKRPPRWVVG